MRFVQFTGKNGGPQHLGVQLVQGGDIIAVSAVDSRIPNTLKKFLEGGDDLLKKAKREDEVNVLTIIEREKTHKPDDRRLESSFFHDR